MYHIMAVDNESSIPKKVSYSIIISVGVEEWAVRVIQGMYANARSRVRVNGQLSEEWE